MAGDRWRTLLDTVGWPPGRRGTAGGWRWTPEDPPWPAVGGRWLGSGSRWPPVQPGGWPGSGVGYSGPAGGSPGAGVGGRRVASGPPGVSAGRRWPAGGPHGTRGLSVRYNGSRQRPHAACSYIGAIRLFQASLDCPVIPAAAACPPAFWALRASIWAAVKLTATTQPSSASSARWAAIL